MTCEECNKAKDEFVIPYRWKHATILIVACREHGKEILDVLNEYQSKRR